MKSSTSANTPLPKPLPGNPTVTLNPNVYSGQQTTTGAPTSGVANNQPESNSGFLKSPFLTFDTEYDNVDPDSQKTGNEISNAINTAKNAVDQITAPPPKKLKLIIQQNSQAIILSRKINQTSTKMHPKMPTIGRRTIPAT